MKNRHGWLPWLLLLLLLVTGCSSARDLKPVVPNSAPAPSVTGQEPSNVGFSSESKWQEHFRKHGKEFGPIDANQYLRLAQELRDKPAGGDVLEATRPDGVGSRYDRATGSFVAYNRNRTLRTFFKPRDGERYYRRQLNRSHE